MAKGGAPLDLSGFSSWEVRESYKIAHIYGEYSVGARTVVMHSWKRFYHVIIIVIFFRIEENIFLSVCRESMIGMNMNRLDRIH